MTTVYITAPPDVADEIAETVVEERLAACVNRLSTDSTYRWEGDVHHDEEVILLAKTTTEAYERLVDRVLEIHPYDVPCLERFDEDDVLEAFAEWRTGCIESD